jgi:ATP-dependent protease ClpP protease subunit
MLDRPCFRLAEATGSEAGQIRGDARLGTHLSARQALDCGLVQAPAAPR